MSSSTMLLDLPLSEGKARAKFFQIGPDVFGLCLTDYAGRPTGRGKTLTKVQATRLKKDIDGCKTLEHIRSLIWATLGYGTHMRTPVAATYTHPGRRPF